jgi:hypothetical protein
MDTVQFRAAVDSLVARTAGPAADQVAGPLAGAAADQVAGLPTDLAGTGRMAIMCAETMWSRSLRRGMVALCASWEPSG